MTGRDKTLITVRTTRRCMSCGRAIVNGEPALGTRPVCLTCLAGQGNAYSDDDHERLSAMLADRARVGARLGNAKAMVYPEGIDLTLRTILDALRQYLLEVRVELRVEGQEVIHDGHLRRVDDVGDEEFVLVLPASLGFFINPDDTQPRTALAEEDYRQIVRISLIDRILVGRAGPRVVWQASDERLVEVEVQSVTRCRRERWLAILLLIHITLVLAVLIGGFLPIYRAYRDHRVLDATGWGLIWWFASVIVGSSLGAWEQFPRLSALATNNRASQPTVGSDRGHQDSTASEDRH